MKSPINKTIVNNHNLPDQLIKLINDHKWITPTIENFRKVIQEPELNPKIYTDLDYIKFETEGFIRNIKNFEYLSFFLVDMLNEHVVRSIDIDKIVIIGHIDTDEPIILDFYNSPPSIAYFSGSNDKWVKLYDCLDDFYNDLF